MVSDIKDVKKKVNFPNYTLPIIPISDNVSKEEDTTQLYRHFRLYLRLFVTLCSVCLVLTNVYYHPQKATQ